MALVRWAPCTELETFGRDPFFRRFFETLHEDEICGGSRTWFPALDLVEEKDCLVVRVELPGVDPKNAQIDLQDDVLTIRGQRQDEVDDNKAKYLKREHVFGSFTRTVQLPYHVQGDKVKAQYKNGIMSITLPKAEEHVGRQIPIEIEK